MNELKIFENKEFGSVRLVQINREPWFVGKDVANVLGYQNGSRDINVHVDEDDRLRYQISTAGQMREQTLINESGVYALIFGSKLPAAKRFKHWVTSEVLPAIRKTGIYAALPDFTNPVIAARAWADEAEAKEKALKKLQEAQPKADYYDKCMNSTNLYTTTEVAQEIGWNAAELYNFLHEHGVIYRVGYRATSKKKPYLYPWVLSPRYLWLQDEGIADIITYWLPNGKTTKTIKWTCKGAKWVQDFVDKHN